MPALRRTFLPYSAALCLFAVVLPAAAWGQTPSEAAGELARRIVASVGPRRAVALKIRNLSTLRAADVSEVLSVLANELQAHGIRLGEEASPDAEVIVTVSENIRGFLLVAQIRKGESEEVAMVPFARPSGAAASVESDLVRLEKKLLWEQEAPILDVAPISAGAGALLVLGPDKVSLLEKKGTGWTERQSASIPVASPWPRDLRGRLLVEDDGFWAYLPGMVCGGIVEASPLRITMDCREADDPWPIHAGGQLVGYAHFAARRNSFDGRVEPAQPRRTELPPFFSAAGIPAHDRLLWLVAGVDGQTRLFGDGAEPEAAFDGWGSDVAAVKTSCGSGWQVLATGTGDAQSADSIRVLEISGREANAVSAPLALPGPVTALWPAGENSTIAVTRNLKSGRYEAYSLSIVCSR